MKNSIRTRFTLGMIFIFLIILILSVFSGYFLNKLSNKTSAILKENYLSVVYAREMTAGITDINMEILTSFLEKRKADSTRITKDLEIISNSLRSEKSNLTEVGEDKIVAGIDAGITEYRDSVIKYLKSPVSNATLLYLQHKSGELYQHLQLLSEINGKAIEIKTDDAKIASKRALSQMTILASVCFLIGMSFTFSFASYFNQRFLQLYRGIKEIVSRDSDSRLFFDGKDEFYEISLIINEMAEKLTRNKQKIHVTLQEDPIKDTNIDDVQELKRLMVKIKNIEEQAAILISKLEQK
jgi:two-component system, NtrC family, sensor histidine kinase KinB